MLSKWSTTPDSVTAKLILMVAGMGNGQPPVSDRSGRSNTGALTREGPKARYQHPLNRPVVEFDGDKFTGTVEGVFTDHWERLR